MNRKRSAFTLIELLVVITILAILATALATGIHSVKRQAQTTQCQAHMRNLHQGVMNYFTEQECYPAAGSYEYKHDIYDPPSFWILQGWVGWILGEGDYVSEAEEKDSHKSKAHHYKYVGCGIEDDPKAVRNSIRYGALFDYVRKDYSIFFCKQFNNGKGKAHRTYAMNNYFGSRTNPRAQHVQAFNLTRDQKEASRLALFVELAYTSGAKGASGFCGKTPSGSSLKDDSSWDWSDDFKENYGCWHKKGNKRFGHVIFLDGHIESILENDEVRMKSKMLGDGKAQ